jgi:radical SAM superfamily enzyme YgiQ (UPF0313 family)
MELPRRPRSDELLRPGELLDLRRRLRAAAPRQDLTAVVACAFDHRTRMLPFIFADTHMAPAGVRAIASALVDSGIEKVRIVLQQWNPRFDPEQMRVDGRIPDLFCVSSMTMHGQRAMAMIQSACRIAPEQRPLIIAGGPRAVYEPYTFFEPGRDDASADVVVTGEEFIFLSLIEAILDIKAPRESMRSAFTRLRDQGGLDDILGLVYPVLDRGRPTELVDTGVQRLLGDLDELPNPVIGYGLLEAPSRKPTLAAQPVPASRIRRLSPISSVVLTYGCKFACKYCPIPAYNQRQHRLKSGQRIAEEMHELNATYGLKYFFGADDNFFNDHDRTLDIVRTLAHSDLKHAGKPLRKRVRWHTEVTVHDTLKMREHLALVRDAGCRGLWLGVEDMTATLVKKGQSANNTIEAFQLLCNYGIAPNPMMMHHDSQPLYSPGSNYGIVNQVNQLRKAGAISVQVLMLTPSPGSVLHDGTYTSGQAFRAVAGREVEPWMHDGNYVIASQADRPWQKQVNLWLAYLSFYNPLNFVRAIGRRRTKLGAMPWRMQMVGMIGVTQNIRRTFTWTLRLMTGRIERATQPPGSALPMRSPTGDRADHAPATSEPDPALVQVSVEIPKRSADPAPTMAAAE